MIEEVEAEGNIRGFGLSSLRGFDDWPLDEAAQSGPAKVSTQVMFTKIPPAAAGGLFSPKLSRTRKIFRNPAGGSRWIIQSQATEDTKDFPQSHRRQPVDYSVPSYRGHERFSAIPPAAAGGSFSPKLCFPLLDARAGIERSTGCRRWDSRAFLAPCRPGLNDPTAAAGGIPQSQNLCSNFSCPVCAASAIRHSSKRRKLDR